MESVTFTGEAISGVSTLDASGTVSAADLVLDATAATITHSAASDAANKLTIVSTNNEVLVESVTFTGAAISGVSTLDASSTVSAASFDASGTVSVGRLKLASTSKGNDNNHYDANNANPSTQASITWWDEDTDGYEFRFPRPDHNQGVELTVRSRNACFRVRSQTVGTVYDTANSNAGTSTACYKHFRAVSDGANWYSTG